MNAYPTFRAPWSPGPAPFEVGRHDDDRSRRRGRDRDGDRGGRRWWGRGGRDWSWGWDVDLALVPYLAAPAYYWPPAPAYYWPPAPPPYAYPLAAPQYPYPAYAYPGAGPYHPQLPPPAIVAGRGGAAVGAPPPQGGSPGDRTMYGNPYAYPYGYPTIGQEAAAVAVPPAIQAIQAAQIRSMQGMVPVYNNGLVPAVRSDLPTNRVFAEVDAVDARAVPVLVPEMGISPRSNLMKGFKHASEKICGKGCGHVLLRTDFPFLIERLWVDTSDACKFDIELIIVGQRVLSTGDGFNAKWLRRRDGRHGFRFDFNMAIDHRHPLKFYVKNRSHKSRRFRVAAWGEQIGE